MNLRTKIAVVAFNLILASHPVVAASQPAKAAAADRQLPQVSGPIPATAQSRPFLGAQAAIEASGYIEEEYFLTGNANTYDWTGKGRSVKVIAGPGKYVTRILVMRPRNASRFGGNVEVTVLNASLNLDFGGPADFARMVKQGDVWIGITTKAVTANALKKFDPVRYAPLDWSNPAPPERRCAQPTMIPTYMAGGKEVLEAMAKGDGCPRGAILTLGYAGWGAGQLEREIRENVWLTVAADEALVFDEVYETKWARALGKLGVDPGFLSSEAGQA